ncbi:hypothetical protein KOW79_022178 [Hemibagrus wyckioides]|uniref:Uncharacterized protein n=1 Tax=Hemibagrus wyckioides TaxID=337641 RepID=A0A9D3N3H2_9TELE|nr:hypothetical protein KOW79_022178 [Hemibagrus wyckioides]
MLKFDVDVCTVTVAWGSYAACIRPFTMWASAQSSTPRLRQETWKCPEGGKEPRATEYRNCPGLLAGVQSLCLLPIQSRALCRPERFRETRNIAGGPKCWVQTAK